MAERARDDAVHTPVYALSALTGNTSRDGAPATQHGTGEKLSIEHKLPLIIGALLLLVILVISTAAYVEMRRTSLAAASVRLASVSNQFRDAYQQSGTLFRTLTATTAAADVVRRYALSRSPALRDSVRAALTFRGPQPEQTIRSELRDGSGALLLATTASPMLDAISVTDVTTGLQGADSVMIGKFRMAGDSLVYHAAGRVHGGGGAYVIHWRRQSSSQRTREQISRLIGSDAAVLVGNADFSLWTDFAAPVAIPVSARATDSSAHIYRAANGAHQLIYTTPIPGTPWAVGVAMPLSTVFAPITAFLGQIAVISVIALVIGLTAAWLVSRRITAPLVELTRAADAIAHGRVTRTISLKRSDELGRLARAFGTMAGEVEHARTALELKVDERTRDLHVTMKQLQDTQESLVRREKLAMLGQLASGVGHELRNPLGVMTNAVYYLKMVLSSSPKNVHEYLDILQQQITLSEKIVGDLLDFARLRPPQRERTSLAELTATQLARLGSLQGVEVLTEIPAELPSVMVDPVQVGQIVFNLLTNAAQAIDGQGRVVIRGAVVGDEVHYEVTDSGSGILPENMEKIFEPLFTTKARGIGLGLAVSRTLARSNGGDLTATSTPGEGATFRLSLPAETHA